MKTAAIYTRVSSEQQKENKTIESQVGTLVNFAKEKGYILPEEYIFRDEGYSGAVLVRPGQGYATLVRRGRSSQYWFIARIG